MVDHVPPELEAELPKTDYAKVAAPIPDGTENKILFKTKEQRELQKLQPLDIDTKNDTQYITHCVADHKRKIKSLEPNLTHYDDVRCQRELIAKQRLDRLKRLALAEQKLKQNQVELDQNLDASKWLAKRNAKRTNTKADMAKWRQFKRKSRNKSKRTTPIFLD